MIRRATIESVRQVYVDEFRRVLAATENVHLEPALRTSDGALATDGELRLPYRPDLLSKAGGSSIMIDTPTRLQFEHWESNVGAAQVSVSPFIWDYAKISIEGRIDDWTPVKDWFYGWFDPEDQNSLNEEGLYGVVHYVSDPVIEEGFTSITVDLGSAPTEAFFSLLDAVLALRPSRVEVA